jgi:hypothetical protein
MQLAMKRVGPAARGGSQVSPMSSASCVSSVWQRLRLGSIVRYCVRLLTPGDLDTARPRVGGMLIESDICAGVYDRLF